MRIIVCTLLFMICVSVESSADERPSRDEGVERAMLAIDLEMELKNYRRIVNSLHKANFEAAMVRYMETDSKEAVERAMMRVKILENMKETAAYNAMELERKLKGNDGGKSSPTMSGTKSRD